MVAGGIRWPPFYRGARRVTAEYTKEELRKFKRLYDKTGSLNGGTRVIARLEMNDFVKEHGKEKCDAMFEAITKGEKK